MSNRTYWYWAGALGAALGISIATLAVPTGAASSTSCLSGPHRVIAVVDGDTIKLDGVGTIRLAGIDAPELHHPRKGKEPCGEEAKEWLARWVMGQDVVIVAVGTDRYGRILGWLWLGELSVNIAMVSRGWAKVYTSEPSPWSVTLLDAQMRAEKEHLGLWKSQREGGCRP